MIIRCFLICIAFLGFSHKTCWSLGAADILHQVQQRYAAGDFEADFIQESHLKAMGMIDAARGHLYFGSPGMMRWHYQTPEEHFIITNGDTVWIYRPAENQVILGRAIDYFGEGRGADFFSKPGELYKEFIVSLAPKELQKRGHYVLKLVPNTERPDLNALYLFISRETFDITQIVTHNAFGDKTTIRFENYRFGQGLNASLFIFEIPDGAEVLKLHKE